MSDDELPAAGALLKSFDPRPLISRAKVVLTILGALAMVAFGLSEIIWGKGSPDIVERCITWCGIIVTAGLGVVGVDDARTKPILAKALDRVIAGGGGPPDAT